MKRLKLFLLVALTGTMFLQSCSKFDSSDSASLVALVTVRETMDGSFYGVTDENERIFVGDDSNIPTYEPKDGQRSLMYFSPIEGAPVMDGFDFNAKIYSMLDLLTKPVAQITDIAGDTLGTTPVYFHEAWVGGNYINVEHTLLATNTSTHVINLADNEIDDKDLIDEDGYVNLTLHHNSDTKYGDYVRTIVCFDISQYTPQALGQEIKGYIIRYNDLQYGDDDDINVQAYKIELDDDDND